MSGCRQTFSLWFHIKKVFQKPTSEYYTRWKRLVDLMRLRVDNNYFWHDSFGRYFNQLIGCRILGHRKITWLPDGGCSSADQHPHWHCFNCEQEVDPGVDKVHDWHSQT